MAVEVEGLHSSAQSINRASTGQVAAAPRWQDTNSRCRAARQRQQTWKDSGRGGSGRRHEEVEARQSRHTPDAATD